MTPFWPKLGRYMENFAKNGICVKRFARDGRPAFAGRLSREPVGSALWAGGVWRHRLFALLRVLRSISASFGDLLEVARLMRGQAFAM